MKKQKVLIVGAGVAGRELYVEIRKHFNRAYEIVGFLDDDEKVIGKKIGQVKVLGDTSKLRGLIEKNNISEVFIAIPSAQGSLIRKVIKNCERQKVVFKIVPRLLEIVEGKVKLSKVREIEIGDLLGRALVKTDQKRYYEEFKNKVVLVTGAAGSIGSEICRQIMEFRPKKLIALDCWESGIFDLELELSEIDPNKKVLNCVIANIQDEKRILGIPSSNKPDIVFHAAAYKHVPLMQKYPEEAVKNNVFGTKNMMETSLKAGVAKFINISTDKAVEPSSVMGATKLIAELMATQYNKKGITKFCSVRFGNVLGSQGSVIPIFKKQIAKGGPVTITHKNMTRFFMTIPEAVQLVLSASLYVNKGGEVFMLDMGEPVKIEELARLMIRLAGFVPDVDIKIVYSGIRPGEKLVERLNLSDESKQNTANGKIFLINSAKKNIDVEKLIKRLKIGIDKNSRITVISGLKYVAPNLQRVR